MLRCVLPPTQNVVKCGLRLSGCSDTIFRLRMMLLCVLRHARVAAQAAIAKQVDQHPPPHSEDAAHASEEAAHHPPHPVGPLKLQDAAKICSPPPTGCYVIVTRTLRHRMQCVLPDTQPAAQARTVQKVDQDHLPPPGPGPGQVSPSLLCGDSMCDILSDKWTKRTSSKCFPPPSYPRRFFPSLPPPPFDLLISPSFLFSSSSPCPICAQQNVGQQDDM